MAKKDAADAARNVSLLDFFIHECRQLPWGNSSHCDKELRYKLFDLEFDDAFLPLSSLTRKDDKTLWPNGGVKWQAVSFSLIVGCQHQLSILLTLPNNTTL